MAQYEYVAPHGFAFNWECGGRDPKTHVQLLDTIVTIGDSSFYARQLPQWLHDYIFIPHEVQQVYYDNGNVFKIFKNYGEGFEDNYLEYYENGQLKIQGQYCDHCPDMKNGIWYYYDQNGKLLKSVKPKIKRCDGEETCN